MPERMAGRMTGNVTRVRVRNKPAPDMNDASSYVVSTERSAAEVNRNI